MKKAICTVAAMVFLSTISCTERSDPGSSEMSRDAVVSQGTALAQGQAVPYGGYPFKEGMDLARKTGRPVVLYFFTTWCGYCRAMDKMVFYDGQVIEELRDRFVYIRIDTEGTGIIRYKNHQLRPSELALMMGVQGFPTTVYLDKNQAPVTRIPGFIQKNMFLDLLGYIGDECYNKNVSFDHYTRGSVACRKGGGR
ncbi:MAG: thioredoxin fold domain-containing protein [Spirochaetes bacterium]|nr:thioredoxin fold domain-containing protein [Spirochaetota bacterium]